MIIEILTILAILTGGVFLMRAAGLGGWGLPALGFVAGIALLSILGGLQTIIGQPTHPASTLGLTVLVPLGLWAWYHKKGLAPSFRILPAVSIAGGISAMAAVLHIADRLNLSPDSYRYAQVGALLACGKIELAQPDLLLNRLLAVPLMHAPANLTQAFFLTSLSPLLAMATVASLAWFCQQGLPTEPDQPMAIRTLPLMAGLLLLTNQFFIYNAFYINGHMFFAALLLCIAGSAWLRARDAGAPKKALSLLALCAVPAMIITRPEGGLQAGLALLPVLVSDRFPRHQKASLLAVLSLSIIFWNGFLWLRFSRVDMAAPPAVQGMFVLGITGLAFLPLLSSQLFSRLSHHILPAIEIALWAALLITAILNPSLFSMSAQATLENIVMGEGYWGYSLITLGFLLAGTLAVSKTPERIFLRFPVTTFIPLGFLLAFLRDQPYRMSPLDSFNRMFLHIVPLAILLIVSAVKDDSRKSNKKSASFF